MGVGQKRTRSETPPPPEMSDLAHTVLDRGEKVVYQFPDDPMAVWRLSKAQQTTLTSTSIKKKYSECSAKLAVDLLKKAWPRRDQDESRAAPRSRRKPGRVEDRDERG